MSEKHPRFLRLAEVRNRVPYSRSTIYQLIAQGEFPKPINLGARAVAWLIHVDFSDGFSTPCTSILTLRDGVVCFERHERARDGGRSRFLSAYKHRFTE